MVVERFLLGLGLALAGALGAAGAAASELCVVCAGPDATYRCAVKHADRVEQFRGGDRVVHYACITELARQGGHEKCSVRRDTGAVCQGELKSVGAGAVATAVGHIANERSAEGRATGPSPPETKDEAKGGEPKTMVELARRTGEASQDQLKKSGDAVGNAMKKTWDCLASLFKRC